MRRTFTFMLLAIALLVFGGAPLLLSAQSVDTTIVTAPPATSMDLWNTLVTLALGLATPFLMRGLEWLSTWLKHQPPLTKRLVVSAIPNIVAIICMYLSKQFPWFPWDPQPVNAMIATAIAFGVHAGDSAIQAKRDVRDDVGR